MSSNKIPVFDGHNDTLLKLEIEAGTPKERSFFERTQQGHIDLPRAREGGFAGGLFAMFVPSNIHQDFTKPFNPRDPANYAEISQPEALGFTLRMAARARRLERDSEGGFTLCRSVADIEKAMAADSVAAVLHIEGAEAIDTDFNALEVLHAAGLRSLGPVWSRKNAFADGVPMAFPSSPDTGPGLTDTGKALVKACNDLKILIDLSHLTEKGFWDVAKTSRHPLVASHSNAHTLCQSARNLTDRQLDAIRESDGLVGVNFHIAFLREDGRYDRSTPLETIVRHFAYLVERLGEDRVGFGSDFDGCMVPAELGDSSGLQKLIQAFRDAGFGDSLIEKLSYKNWLRVLSHTQN
ncbi:dipeptidase [uncultured Roseibium sp.]|uniref:dipeptidase n=1 Tax=uncultured Roseibium sp. TaxID=1936171 RepID=UPI003216525F